MQQPSSAGRCQHQHSPQQQQQVLQTQQQQIAIEIAADPVPGPLVPQHIHQQELQAHALLAQCQQPQGTLPTPNVDIVLRESTRANLVSRKGKGSSIEEGGGGTGGGGGRRSGRSGSSKDGGKGGDGKSVYRKFFKRIKTILDGNDPEASSSEYWLEFQKKTER